MKRAIVILLFVFGCKYNLPESRIGDYVWFGEIWSDTLDTSLVYFDSVYTGTDKLGYGMIGGIVWFVVGDTSDTACRRDFKDRDVYQFHQSDEFDKRYKLKGFFPGKPRFTYYDTLTKSDTIYINMLPDTLYTGKTYTFIWRKDAKANWYMVRLVGKDTTYGFYYCYKEILDTIPRITFYLPENSDDCYYEIAPINFEVVNVYRKIFDKGTYFGEFRFMSRVSKRVYVVIPSS